MLQFGRVLGDLLMSGVEWEYALVPATAGPWVNAHGERTDGREELISEDQIEGQSDECWGRQYA